MIKLKALLSLVCENGYSKVFSEISRGGNSKLIFHVHHIGV